MPVIRVAVRSLRRSPAFTAIAVTSLALALALTTAVVSVVDTVRHPRSMMRDADRLFTVWIAGTGAGGDITNADRIRTLQARLPSAGAIALSGFFWNGAARAGDRSLRVSASQVSANYFHVGGVRPFLGRFFTEGSVDQDVGHAIVISHELWRRYFNGERRLDRLSLTLGDRTFQVIGVTPAVTGGDYMADAWLALPRTALESPTDSRYLMALVRLKDGADLASLQRDAIAAARYLALAHGDGRVGFSAHVLPVKADPLELSELHWVLLAAALSVLLIACANLANLVLARGLARQRDMAVRLSLGARRRDVVREILAECLVVAAAGAAVGTLAGYWAVQLLITQTPDSVPYLGTLHAWFSWRVGAASAVAALGSGVLFGLFPALRLSDLRLTERLRETSGGTTGRRRDRYSGLVIGQVSVALALLTGASLLLRASERIRSFDYGFDPRSLLRVSVGGDRHADSSARAVAQLNASVESRIAGLRHVQSVAWVGGRATDGASVTGELAGGGTRSQYLRAYSQVSGGYFRTMNIGLVAGRDFAPGEAELGGAAIVDEALARRLWNQESPIGRLIKPGAFDSNQAWLRVIGVARSIRTNAREENPADEAADASPGALYVVLPDAPPSRTYVVRARPADQPGLMLDIDRALRDLMAGSGGSRERLVWVKRWSEQNAELLQTQEFLSRLFGGFGLAALFLCALGLYSVLSYAVNQRTREYGIRMAVGAQRSDVFRGVLRDGAVLVLAGTAIGGFVTIWSNTLFDRYIGLAYHVDAVALVVAEAVLIVVALLATTAPAWRAMRSNPVEVLRAV